MPSKLAFKIFGTRLKKKSAKYANLHMQLRQARISISVEMYMAQVYFYSIIAAVIGAVVGVVLGYLVVFRLGLFKGPVTKISQRQLGGLMAYKDIFIFILFVGLLIAAIGGITYVLMKSSAGSKARTRKGKINKVLPHAITYMYAMSKGGMNIIEVFKSLANAEDTYGEFANEVRMIINDMEFFGYDLRAALQHAIETSPSDDFKDIMHSLLTVVDSGGNITSYFADKSEHYLNKAIMDQKGFLETLGLMAESYVTALVAGPLFIVIIQTVIALLSPGGDISLYAIIYIMIPAGSLMFVFVINIMTPGDVKGAPLIEIEQKYDMDIKIPEDSTEKELLEQLGESRKKLGYKHFLQHPIQPVFEKPFRALYVSGPAGLIFLLVGVFVLNRNRAFEVIDDYMIYMTFIILTPFVFFYEAKSRKEKKLKGEIPGFLHRLALTNEIGMTIPESIELMAKQETGIMTDEIRKIQRDLNWGLSVQDAFARFANRLRVGAVSRTVKLLIEALKSSGNIREVLYITSNDAKTTQVLDKERALNMLIYIVIIYMSFMVFAIVVMIMCSSFLPVMAESGAAAAKAAGGMRTGAGLQVIDLPKYKRLFFHAAVFQGFGGGLMAGQMGEGKALAGFKHSLIMVMIAFVMFRMFI